MRACKTGLNIRPTTWKQVRVFALIVEILGFALQLKKEIKAEVIEREERKTMQKQILMSVMTIGIAAAMLGAGTFAYFSDVEITTDNTFAAGELDLLIDCRSTRWYVDGTTGQMLEWQNPIFFEEKDLVCGDKFFDWHDLKPGDYGEATISFHVQYNDAWGWFRFCNVEEGPGATPEPEAKLGPDEGELSEHIIVRLWIDDGEEDGWQSGDPLAAGDWYEGDNIWQEGLEEVIYYGPMAELYAAQAQGWFGHFFMEDCTTYYIGWSWEIPYEVCNIIQGDWLEFDIEFYVEQWRNNPDPTPPDNIDDMEPCRCLEKLVAEVLDGQAEDDFDNFEIYLDGYFVGDYEATGGSEDWIMHEWDVSHLEIPACGVHEVKIVCTASAAWSGFASYGQLAVNYTALYRDCDTDTPCDEVDIGNPTSEAGHNLIGWGPIEPAASGAGPGSYGGIDDCRCTWYQPDVGDDEPWATVELTCDCSYMPPHP